MTEGWAVRAARLLGKRGGELYNVAFALTGEPVSAERLYRAGVVKALKSATRKTTQEEISVFARRGVYSVFLEEMGRPAGSRGTPPVPTGQTDPFLAALDTLDAQHRLCVVMRFYEGLSCAAIAQDLDLLPLTIRRYLDSAIEKLGRPLHDLGLDKHELHFGGWTPGATASGMPQHTPTDALSRGFAHVDGLASTGSRHATGSSDPAAVVQAVARQSRRHAVAIACLVVFAVGSLGIGGWTATRAFAHPTAEPDITPSPQPSGLYGTGVLASDDILGPSVPWQGDTEVQRLLVCDPAPGDPSDDPGYGGIQVTSVGLQDDHDHGYDAPLTTSSGTCVQRQTEAAALSVTIIPFDGTSGHNNLTAVITLKNEGAEPLAILRDSIGLYFELPWGALSSLSSSHDVVMRLSGSSLDNSPLGFTAVPAETVFVLQPGVDLVLSVSGQVLRDDAFDRLPDNSGIEMTPEIMDQYRRSMSIIGELSENDPLIAAFHADEYVPPVGVAVTVAPTDPESTQYVVLWVVQDQVGVPPSPSPSPSAPASA